MFYLFSESFLVKFFGSELKIYRFHPVKFDINEFNLIFIFYGFSLTHPEFCDHLEFPALSGFQCCRNDARTCSIHLLQRHEWWVTSFPCFDGWHWTLHCHVACSSDWGWANDVWLRKSWKDWKKYRVPLLHMWLHMYIVHVHRKYENYHSRDDTEPICLYFGDFLDYGTW